MPVMAARLWLKVSMNRDLYGSKFTTPTWSVKSFGEKMKHSIVHCTCMYTFAHTCTYTCTVRVKKNFTCPFRLTDRMFPLYFLSQERPHPFNIRLI